MTVHESTIPQPVNFIADHWTACATDDGWNVDPNTGEPLHRRVTTSPDDLERALQHAERSYDGGPRGEAALRERAAMLERVADLLEARAEDVARTDALTSGVPISVTRKVAAFLPARIRATAADLTTVPRVRALEAGGRDVRLLKVPWGPAAILTPWNGPRTTDR
jgi:acyl-CoA reductase-like NAD-dependent aldehyde dehydrogenase